MAKDLNELKAQNAAVYNEAKEEGVKAEQKRVASFGNFKEKISLAFSSVIICEYFVNKK